MTELHALGKGPMPANRDGLETIPLPHWTRVVFRSGELQAQCPVTGQPDLYQLELAIDADLTLESKSLKLYLWSWAGEAIFAEHLAHRIADDVWAVLARDHAWPDAAITVELVQSIRGGITTTVRATRSALPGGA